MDNEGVYRTGEAAARAGVSEPVLRMWERRYGLAPPARSSGGHRRYSESNVAVVRRAVELIAAGMTTDAAVTAARAEVNEDPAQPSAGPRPLSEIRRRRDAAVLVRRHLVEKREALFAEREVIVRAFDTLTGRRRPPTAADAADAGPRRRQQRDL